VEYQLDRLEELSLLVAIVEGGSLAAAARKTGRSPPAVTRILADLERRLGVRLAERTTRSFALTDAGRRLADSAHRLLGDYQDAMRDAAGEAAAPRGRLRISAPIVFGQRHVAPLVSAYLDLYPEVQAELSLADRVVDLVEEGFDLALRIAHLDQASLIARRVGSVRRVVVASPAYLDRRGIPTVPEHLAEHEIVFFAPHPSAPQEWRFADPAGCERRVRLTVRFQVDRAEAAIGAARDGRGVLAALSYQVAPDLAARRLIRLLGEFEPAPVPVHLVHMSARLLAPRVRTFLDFAAPRLSALKELRPD
jgi:DNA-binding transcriptional LysR family regulator